MIPYVINKTARLLAKKLSDSPSPAMKPPIITTRLCPYLLANTLAIGARISKNNSIDTKLYGCGINVKVRCNYVYHFIKF